MDHFLNELEKDRKNLAASIKEVDRELLGKTDVALHEFNRWPTYFINSDKEWQCRTAFLVHHYDFFDVAHRALMEVLAGYYSNGHILLRNAFELIIKGALWECLAHPEFRDKADVLREYPVGIYGTRKTILDWLEECGKEDPSILSNMDSFSWDILEGISHLYSEEDLKKLIPNFSIILKQLSAWGMFHPIEDPLAYLYDETYNSLSKDTHGAPNRTLVGKRLMAGEAPFKHNILPEEFNDFCSKLMNVIDIGLTLQLNMFDVLMRNPENIKTLKAKLPIIKELGLPITAAKIKMLIGKKVIH